MTDEIVDYNKLWDRIEAEARAFGELQRSLYEDAEANCPGDLNDLQRLYNELDLFSTPILRIGIQILILFRNTWNEDEFRDTMIDIGFTKRQASWAVFHAFNEGHLRPNWGYVQSYLVKAIETSMMRRKLVIDDSRENITIDKDKIKYVLKPAKGATTIQKYIDALVAAGHLKVRNSTAIGARTEKVVSATHLLQMRWEKYIIQSGESF